MDSTVVTTVKNSIIAVATLTLLLGGFSLHALYKKTYIPNNNGLYYLIGGGNVEPLPYASDETDIDLGIEGVNGLGYNCGIFNPLTAILHSLNGGGAKRLEQQVFSSATGAILELPAYEMAKHFPSQYRLIQDGIGAGQKELALSTKSCQQMSAQIDEGKNPYNQFAQASMGQKWKFNMGLAGSSYSRTGLGAANGDINQTATTVSKDNGKSGVQWVRGVQKDGALHAGGEGQPVIMLVSDTVIAGYNVLIGGGRAYSDRAAPPLQNANHWLVGIFPSPLSAAQWVVNVVGEMKVTTYPGGAKSSVPGKGIGMQISKQLAAIKPILQGLVTGSTTLTAANLKKVSTNEVALNETIIRKIQNMTTPLAKALVINNLAERIATLRVMAKAKLARNLLTVGSEVPSIFTLNAAQNMLAMYQSRLTTAITTMRNSARDNQSLLASPIATIVSTIASNENASASIRPSQANPTILQNGAIQMSATKDNHQ